MSKLIDYQKEIKNYINDLNEQFKTGRAGEQSYRGKLEILLKNFLPKGLTITNEPARVACGAPDYVITRQNVPIAFIETKDIGDPDLQGQNRHKEQFDRYKSYADSIIFTDYLDFYLYQKGCLIDSVRIAEVRNNRIQIITSKIEKFKTIFEKLIEAQYQTISSPDLLAKILAAKAKFLANTIESCLKNKEQDTVGTGYNWHTLLRIFRKNLVFDLDEKSFADMYAQTISYGLFVARLNDPSAQDFSRQEACNLIPKINPFLREFFQNIGGYDIDDRVRWIIEDLASLFLKVDIEKIKDEYRARNSSDPFYHFYELFLSEYDSKLRKAKGVWYTPLPVVKFIVTSIDKLLQSEFGLKQGLADYSKIKTKERTDIQDNRTTDKVKRIEKEYHRVQILDPATGSGTFLVEVVNEIYNKFKTNQGMWQSYVAEHLLERLNGFEIMVAPYVIAHLKLSTVLKDTGFDFGKLKPGRRQNIFLTNALEPYHTQPDLFLTALSNEVCEANRIKERLPVMVVLGNPPYNANSQNNNDHIDRLMLSYKQEPGNYDPNKATLQERNPKWLNDDYVKFIRLAQEYVTRNEKLTGLIGLITAHGFIDNPTFRGMRYNLLKTFDKIFIVNLHGNAKKGEICPDGSKDENVFDIQQGVAISFFLRTNKKKKNELGELYYADLWGLRTEKYKFLEANSLENIKFTKVKHSHPHYFFTDKNLGKDTSYTDKEKFFDISELFKNYSSGFVTARDKLCIQSTKEQLEQVIDDFSSLEPEIARQKYKLGDDVRDWTIRGAQKDINERRLSNGSLDLSYIEEVCYRPFDNRYSYYTGKTKGFMCMPRFKTLKHMLKKNENIALTTVKVVKSGIGFHHAFVSDKPIDACYVSNKTSEITYCFPLFVEESESRIPNLNHEILKKFPLKQGGEIDENSAYKIFDYIYAVFYSQKYRKKYQEYLKIGFPRIPYPKDETYFEMIAAYGKKLRQLHLLIDSVDIFDNIGNFEISGADTVDTVKYTDGKLYINSTQYFDNVPLPVYEYQIGSYKPVQKWLSDRLKTKLSFADLENFTKILQSINKTIAVAENIDQVIDI